MAVLVQNPFAPILGLNGAGLTAGQLYVGAENADPQVEPIAVYWDAALTEPARQPIDVMAGYIWRHGEPARLYTDGPCSMRVIDRQGYQVFHVASAAVVQAGALTYRDVLARPPAIPPGTDVVTLDGHSQAGDVAGSLTFTTRTSGSPHALTFRAADGRIFELSADLGGWSAAAFGFLPSTERDAARNTANRIALQRAIDHIFHLAARGGGSGSVVISPGQYCIDGAIQLFSWKAEGGVFDNVSIDLTSPARGYVGERRTQIRNTRNDQPAVIIAKARSVRISNISFRGASEHYLPSYRELVGPPGWSNAARMRDTQYSPACGVAIDPFGSSVPPDGGYPGLTACYTSNTGSSSGIIIENCEFQGFPVGVLISPSTDTQIGDSIMIRDCDLSYNTTALATCQDQNRACRAENIRVSAVHTVVDCVRYGNQFGAPPLCSDFNVTYAKYLFSLATSRANAAFTGINAESLYSLGCATGGYPVDIRSCHIKLIPPVVVAQTGPNIDYHLAAFAPVNFDGGSLTFYSNVAVPLSIAGDGMVTFAGTVIDAPVIAQQMENIRYINTPLRYFNGGATFGVQETFNVLETTLAGQDAAIPPGGVINSYSGAANRWRSRSGVIQDQLEARVQITVGRDGEARFPVSAPGKYRVGEWLSSITQVGILLPDGARRPVNNIAIGQVKALAGGVCTLQCVPISLSSGLYEVGVQRLPLFRRRCLGQSREGSDTLTGVMPANHGFKVGDRLLANKAIPSGAWVRAVNARAGTIQISLPALANGPARLQSGDMYLEEAVRSDAPNAEVTYAGDRYTKATPTLDAQGRLHIGWVAATDGAPGTLKPVFL